MGLLLSSSFSCRKNLSKIKGRIENLNGKLLPGGEEHEYSKKKTARKNLMVLN